MFEDFMKMKTYYHTGHGMLIYIYCFYIAQNVNIYYRAKCGQLLYLCNDSTNKLTFRDQ